MTAMDKLKSLFQRADIPPETREVFAQAGNARELMKGLQGLLGKNEPELRENEEQLIAIEKALIREEDRLRRGGLTPTEETTLLRRIQRLAMQRGRLENLVSIYNQNITLLLNLLAGVQEMDAMRLRGVTEDEIDRLVQEMEDNLEVYNRVSLAAEGGPAPVQAADRPREAKELDAIKQRILGAKQPSVPHGAEEPRPQRDLE